MPDKQYILQIYERHRDSLYRLCYFYMGNVQDASDAVQNTLMKLIEHEGVFESESHEKGWLMKVGANECRLLHRQWWRRVILYDSQPLPEEIQQQERYEENAVLQEVLALPKKYRVPIYMHYYEGYSTREISELLQARESTVRSWLLRGKKLLRQTLQESDKEEPGESTFRLWERRS